MDAILFIAFDEGIDVNMMNFIMDDLVEPLPNYLAVRRRNRKISNQNYFENIIPRYTDVQFAEHFRMSRITFEVLLNVMAPLLPEINMNVNASKKLLFALWVLAKQESFLATSDRFGLPKSSGHQIFKSVINILSDLMPQYVKWPNADDCQISSNIFEARSRGFYGVVGAIDAIYHVNNLQAMLTIIIIGKPSILLYYKEFVTTKDYS